MKQRVIVVTDSRRVAGSAAFLLAGFGPRIMLAPDGEGGGGGDGGTVEGEGSGSAGTGGASEGGAGGAGNGNGGTGGDAEPSLLGSGPKPGTGADGNAPPGTPPADDKRETGEKVLGEKGEGKSAEETKADEGPKDIDGNALPETYEFKMPDGFVADQGMLDLATPVFKEHRLSPSQAQAVADLYAQVTKDQVTKHMDTVKGWREAAKTDKALIADGGYDANLALAHKGFQAFGNEELLGVLDTYGLGDHPAVLRAFRDIGKAVGETGTIGGDAATGQVSTADLFFPSMKKA